MGELLMKYDRVKLPRNSLSEGKGIMRFWVRIAVCAAFRTGPWKYCEHVNRLVYWYSKKITQKSYANESENRVALFDAIIRAYISPCNYCEYCKHCKYDCRSIDYSYSRTIESDNIRGPCFPSD